MEIDNFQQLGPDASVKDLEHALKELNDARDWVSQRAKRIAGYLDGARTRVNAEAKVAAMSDAERAALREALTPVSAQ